MFFYQFKFKIYFRQEQIRVKIKYILNRVEKMYLNKISRDFWVTDFNYCAILNTYGNFEKL